MFKVTVVGDYVGRSPNSEKEKIRKKYEVTGVIPTLNSALSVVKNKLLFPALSKKYADFVSFTTYHIVKIEPLDERSREQMSRSEVQYMDRESLLRYIKDNALPVEAKYYPDLFKLREAVQAAKEDEAGYLKAFELKKADLTLDLQMAAANPELFDEKVEADFVASVSNSVSSKASNTAVLRKKTEDRVKGLAKDQERDGEIGPMDHSGDETL